MSNYKADELLEVQGASNAYTQSRISAAMKDVLEVIDVDLEPEDKSVLEKKIGKWLALSYACGYMDCREEKKELKIYV